MRTWQRMGMTFGGAALVLGLAASDVTARIKLATLPDREKVDLRFEHDQATLVEEVRTVSLSKGTNFVDFSWAGTAINKDSIQFRAVTNPDKVNVINVAFPPGENALVWEIWTDTPGPYQFKMSYLMGGFERTVSYVATADHDEKKMLVRKHFKVQNGSGEGFKDAHWTIGYGADFSTTIDPGDAKQMLSAKWDAVPIKKTFTYDIPRFGPKEVVMQYVMENKKENGLGEFALRAGKVRIYQDDGHGTTAFVGEDWGKFTPVGDKMELYLGVSQDLKVDKQQMKNDRINHFGNSYDTDEEFKVKLENFKDEAVVLDFYEHIDGEWEMREANTSSGEKGGENPQRIEFEKKDASTIIFHVPLPPKGQKVWLTYKFNRKHVW